MPRVRLLWKVALMLTWTVMMASCSPEAVQLTIPTSTLYTATPLTSQLLPTETASTTPVPSNTPGNETPTPTERPTSDPPDVAPRILSPEDGTVIVSAFPDFRYEWPPRAWTVNIIIFNDDGYWQEYIFGGGAGMSGWMNSMFTPISPSLPPGTYQWYAFGCRQTAVGGCGPSSETRTFRILG